jgi:hypothetical protein
MTKSGPVLFAATQKDAADAVVKADEARPEQAKLAGLVRR